MFRIEGKYRDMFEGIRTANVAPSYMEVEEGTKPVTAKQR